MIRPLFVTLHASPTTQVMAEANKSGEQPDLFFW
jgi:hypothetical protein